MIYLLGLGPFIVEDDDLRDYALTQDVWVRVSEQVEEWQDPRTEEWRETVEHIVTLAPYVPGKVYMHTGTWYQTTTLADLTVVHVYGEHKPSRPHIMAAEWTN